MGYGRYRRGHSEVTPREVLFSIIIVLVVIAFGVWLVSTVQNSMEEKNEIYYKAVKIDNDSEMFNYAQKTDAGNALVYGTFKAVDTVNIPEIKGDFLYIERIKEEYTRHTREVEKKDANGNTYKTTEVYYTWDYKGTERFNNTQVELFENIYPTSKFDMGSVLTRLKVTNDNFTSTSTFKRLSGGYVHRSNTVRYYYNYVPTEFKANSLVNFNNNSIEPVSANKIEINKGTIEERIESLEKSVGLAGILIWVFIGIFTAVGVVFFVSGHHHWLERG